MSDGKWEYQVRVNLAESFAEAARNNPADPALQPFNDLLARHNAVVSNQLDAFVGGADQAKADLPQLVQDMAAAAQAVQTAIDANDLVAGGEALKEFAALGEQYASRASLYLWTKDTLDRPGVEQKYATRFTIYADGGKEVYAESVADAIIADLQPLVESGMVTKVNKISTDPAKNPQAPPQFQAQ